MNTVTILLLIIVIILSCVLVGVYFLFNKYRSVEDIQKRMRAEQKNATEKFNKKVDELAGKIKK